MVVACDCHGSQRGYPYVGDEHAVGCSQVAAAVVAMENFVSSVPGVVLEDEAHQVKLPALCKVVHWSIAGGGLP